MQVKETTDSPSTLPFGDIEAKDIRIQGEPVYYVHKLSPEFKELFIIPISDVHFGSALFSLNHWNKTITQVLSKPNIFVLCNGDLCDVAIRDSKGDIYKAVKGPGDQRDWMIEHLLPIKDRILGMVSGNHENRIYNQVNLDITGDIAKALHVPYRPEGLILKIVFGSGNNRMKEAPYVYWGYMTHGYGGARTASAKAVKVERLSTFLHADFYVMSHDHVANAAPSNYLMPNNNSARYNKDTGFTTGAVVAHRKMLIKSSSYLKWGGYAEIGGFSPNDLETPIIKLAGTGKPKVRVEI
jgi:hypothetical protein